MARLLDLLGKLFHRPALMPEPDPQPTSVLSPASKVDLVNAINKIRTSYGLGPLASDVLILQSVAQAWADSMAAHDRLTHGNFAGRISVAIPNTVAGEDIAEGQRSVAEVVDSWMKSPLHRANILGQFNAIGVGVATSSSGTIYWCIDVDLLVSSKG